MIIHSFAAEIDLIFNYPLKLQRPILTNSFAFASNFNRAFEFRCRVKVGQSRWLKFDESSRETCIENIAMRTEWILKSFRFLVLSS